MKLMKKALCALLILAMMLPLAACGQKDQVTLNVLNWGDYIDPDLQRKSLELRTLWQLQRQLLKRVS